MASVPALWHKETGCNSEQKEMHTSNRHPHFPNHNILQPLYPESKKDITRREFPNGYKVCRQHLHYNKLPSRRPNAHCQPSEKRLLDSSSMRNYPVVLRFQMHKGTPRRYNVAISYLRLIYGISILSWTKSFHPHTYHSGVSKGFIIKASDRLSGQVKNRLRMPSMR